jgi:solute:Na+ symporter, SSS family
MNQSALIIVVYMLAMLAIGAFGGRIIGLEDFHLAGRRLKTILLTGTFCATIVGASSTLGMAGLGFQSGLPGAWWMLSGTIGMLILSLFFAETVRSKGSFTLPELLGSFYGSRVRAAAAVLISLSWVGVIAVQIAASGKVLAAIFGGEGIIFMIACSLVFVLYTAHGGQSSVVRTDLFQLLIIITGMLALLLAAISSAGPSPLLHQSFPFSPQMGCMDVLSMIIVVGSAYLVGPDMYSRLLSASGPKEARKSALLAALILIPLALVITSLGVFSRLLYPTIPPEDAILSLLTGLLSPPAAGLVAAALLAAFMSSADTSLMTVTSILTFDIYRRIRPESGPANLLKFSRVAVLLIGACALFLAVSLPGIIKTLLIAYTAFTGGLLVPTIAGFYKERLHLTSSGALCAMIGGGTTALFFGQSHPLWGMIVSLVLLLAVSRLEGMLARRELWPEEQ